MIGYLSRPCMGSLAGNFLEVAPQSWLENVRDDLSCLSEVHGILGTYIDWWRLCRDRNEWSKKDSRGGCDSHQVLGLKTCIYLLTYLGFPVVAPYPPVDVSPKHTLQF
jgi:hypothetical protein